MNALSKKKKADKNSVYQPHERIHTVNPVADADPITKERIAQMENYIMKNCLWQFNSRGWDRRKQNAGILGKTAQLLCGEEVDTSTPLEKCYWVDAVCLVEAYRESFPWINTMEKDAVRDLITLLHHRIDWLTIDGSLNEELTVPHY